MLEAKNISKCFGGQVVLKSVNLAVSPREVVGIVGMNGSGKTTLLDILSGKIRPDNGEVWIDDKRFVPGHIFKPQPTVFRCYQVPRLFYGLSVADNLLLGRWFLGENHIAGNANLADVTQQSLACTLSVGQRRRVVLDWVRARIGQVKYFLLDEPAAGGDKALVNLLFDLLNTAQEHGCGVLIVEHRSGVLKNACSRIVYLRDGICSDDANVNGHVPASQPKTQVSNFNFEETPRLTVRDLTVTRNGAQIVNMINLKVHAGEIAVVTGSNGCGKSTLLHAIYGNPSCSIIGGSIAIEGRDITMMKIRERMAEGIHIMPQEGTLFASMPVNEFLRTGTEAICQKVWKTSTTDRLRLDIPILDKIWHRRCGLLSGGERRLVSLARILIIRPRIALLDEPLAGVDTEGQNRVARLIRKLADDGAGVVIAEQEGLLDALPFNTLLPLLPLKNKRDEADRSKEVLPSVSPN